MIFDSFDIDPGTEIPNLSEAKSLAVLGNVYSFLATGDDTNGQYSLFHAVIHPGNDPPLLMDKAKGQWFKVLEGEIHFIVDYQNFSSNYGKVFYIPKGTLYKIMNEGIEPARALLKVVPAGLEKFFWEVGRPVPGPFTSPPPITAEEISRLLAVSPEYSIVPFVSQEIPSCKAEMSFCPQSGQSLAISPDRIRWTTFKLGKDRIVIGRDPGCDIRLPSPAVSGQHVILIRTEKGFLIEDLRSRGGAFINGKLIKGQIPLKDNDQIRIAHWTLVYHS